MNLHPGNTKIDPCNCPSPHYRSTTDLKAELRKGAHVGGVWLDCVGIFISAWEQNDDYTAPVST